jgi:hypothetical protein
MRNVLTLNSRLCNAPAMVTSRTPIHPYKAALLTLPTQNITQEVCRASNGVKTSEMREEDLQDFKVAAFSNGRLELPHSRSLFQPDLLERRDSNIHSPKGRTLLYRNMLNVMCFEVDVGGNLPSLILRSRFRILWSRTSTTSGIISSILSSCHVRARLLLYAAMFKLADFWNSGGRGGQNNHVDTNVIASGSMIPLTEAVNDRLQSFRKRVSISMPSIHLFWLILVPSPTVSCPRGQSVRRELASTYQKRC